ncbi:MAG: hypothetical protein N3B13_07845, partial [Deltaproteobacteria bacterium]|nr:hypothetical protein [Deltaproteobacteria bacterium]
MGKGLVRKAFYITFIAVLFAVVYFARKLDIHPDEAYYFSWSNHLRSGYLDHPPAIAFLIRLSSSIFSENFTIRGINIIVSFLSLAFTGAAIRYLWGSRDLSHSA